MQLRTVDLRENLLLPYEFNASVSVVPFLSFLEKSMQLQSAPRIRILLALISAVKGDPTALQDIPLDEISKYKWLFELIFLHTGAITDDEATTYRAFGVPFLPVFFYGSNRFYRLLKHMKDNKDSRQMDLNEAGFRKHNLAAIYSLIMHRYYDFPAPYNVNITQCLTNASTGLTEYYKLEADTRFIEITAVAPLPELKICSTDLILDECVAYEMLESKLPLRLFKISGFSIINLIDVTQESALANIKRTIVQHSPTTENICYTDIEKHLQVLVKTRDIEFDLYPLFRVNNKLVVQDYSRLSSLLTAEEKGQGIPAETFISHAEAYVSNPRLILCKEISHDFTHGYSYLTTHRQDGVKSLAVVPIFYKEKLQGILGVTSRKEGVLDEKIIAKLDIVLPVLAELLINSIDAFDTALENIIKEKLTPLQPSVQWKFNEAAWHFMESKSRNEIQKVETMIFREVYPLYGAIDIRNSTSERNRAVISDFQVQFSILLETLTSLRRRYNMPLIDEMIFQCRHWQQGLPEAITSNHEIEINRFLEVETLRFLRHFEKRDGETKEIIARYLDAIDANKGIAYQHRKKLELSIQQINTAINNYLDIINLEIQQSYPCYFEKFRTDGIEYDIYIGQSIAPDKPFDALYLKNIRLWQLASMASIAKISHSLCTQLPVPLQTTQLIFINANAIDISFRNDERKFDVEGAYNIRYQLIKKRIDKVRVSSTNERLTQPGKIAVIYNSAKDVDEYLTYIEYLQQQNILEDNVEYLELEELQGVVGLKSLRIGVKLPGLAG